MSTESSQFYRMQWGVDEVRTAKIVRDQLAVEIKRCVTSGVILDDEVGVCETALAAINLVLTRCEGIMVESLELARIKLAASDAETEGRME